MFWQVYFSKLQEIFKSDKMHLRKLKSFSADGFRLKQAWIPEVEPHCNKFNGSIADQMSVSYIVQYSALKVPE